MSPDWMAVRREFPHLDARLYLNTASTGVAWRGAGAAAARFYDEMYARGYDGAADWRAVAGRVRAKVAALANVAADDVGFASSTTEALNLLAHSLPVDQADRVVMMSDEFPSVRAAGDALVSRGATLDLLQVGSETDRTAALAQAAVGARYVLASHVHWETGTKIDLHVLGPACRGAGAMLIVDGIQALGATPVDATQADAYVASVFKWLISGFGLGVVITRPALRAIAEPVFRGYANAEPSRALAYSHANYPALIVLEASLAFMETIGWEAIFMRNQHLADRLRSELDGLDIATPADAAAAIVSIRIPDAAGIAGGLAAQGASVEARGACLRVSPHFYNNEADIDRFAPMLLNLTRGI